MLHSLADRGYWFEIRAERIHVEPVPDAATLDELRAAKLVLLSYIAEHGGRWPIPLASAHRYVIWRGALDNRHLSVFVSCGTPPLLHGPRALDDPLVLDDPGEAPLLRVKPVVAARSIVAVSVAERVVAVSVAERVVAVSVAERGLSTGGRLCLRCQKIGRVNSAGTCTFCLADQRN